MVYVQGNSVPSANIGVLDKLIATRHEIAQVNFFLHLLFCTCPDKLILL